jgi:hypothetical protein
MEIYHPKVIGQFLVSFDPVHLGAPQEIKVTVLEEQISAHLEFGVALVALRESVKQFTEPFPFAAIEVRIFSRIQYVIQRHLIGSALWKKEWRFFGDQSISQVIEATDESVEKRWGRDPSGDWRKDRAVHQ